MIAVKAPPETQLEVPDFSQVCGCCWICATLDGSLWGVPRTQPSMTLGVFGVSPWG